MNHERKICPLCQSEKSKVYHKRKEKASVTHDDLCMTADRFESYGTVLKCRSCGLVYKSSHENSDELMQGYTKVDDPLYLEEKENRSINGFICIQKIKKYKNEGRLLDVGCSTGFFLNAARLSFEPTGVELSIWAVQYAREKLRLDVRQGSLEMNRFPDSFFDVVTSIDVIEHVPNPKEHLKELVRILKPEGLLYIVTPDIGSLSAFLLGRNWWGLRPAHLIYFSKKTMRKICTQVGLEIKEMNSYGRIFTYGYWISRLKNYPKIFYGLVPFFVNIFGWDRKILYLNTRDSMEVCAIKKVASK